MWASGLLELRIDVQLPPSEVEKELDAINRRLHRPGDALYDLPTLDIGFPGLRFRYRVADGEHYIYVEDVKRGCLAGYTIFNRLIELNRRQDKHLRATHSKYAAPYQRRGIATAIYRWWLDGGHSLISGARTHCGARWANTTNWFMWICVRRNYAALEPGSVAGCAMICTPDCCWSGAGWTCTI
jgi:hypothetical protein